MKNIFEVHRKVKNNIGDYYCNPSRYFDFDNIQSGELLNNKFPIKGNTLIIGGGGLIHKKFSQHIQILLDKNPANSIVWGVGHNFSKKHKSKSVQPYYPNWLNRVSLVGIRDWIPGHYNSYLPCVSCMHPSFDKNYELKHEVVFYTHAFKSKYHHISGDMWMKNNENNFEKVIEFLASAQTIVTDSYHGAYWGQLLGKDVRVFSWSVKFDHMKYQPTMLENISNWRTIYKKIAPLDFKEECREININFYNKFLNLL
jgi:hypothetical protein